MNYWVNPALGDKGLTERMRRMDASQGELVGLEDASGGAEKGEHGREGADSGN